MSNEKFRVINASTNPKTSNDVWKNCSSNAIIVDSNASRGSAIFRGNGTSTPTQITPIMKNLNIGNKGTPIYLNKGKIETCIPYSELFTSLDTSSGTDDAVPTSYYSLSSNNADVDRLTIAAGGTYIGNGLRTINYYGINYNYNAQLGFSFSSPGLIWRGRSGGAWSDWKAARAMPMSAYDTTSNASGYGGRQKADYCGPGEIKFNMMLVNSTDYFDRPIGNWANTMMMRTYNTADYSICKYTSMFGMNAMSAKPKAFICCGDNTGKNAWKLENLVTDKYEGNVDVSGNFSCKNFTANQFTTNKIYTNNIYNEDGGLIVQFIEENTDPMLKFGYGNTNFNILTDGLELRYDNNGYLSIRDEGAQLKYGNTTLWVAGNDVWIEKRNPNTEDEEYTSYKISYEGHTHNNYLSLSGGTVNGSIGCKGNIDVSTGSVTAKSFYESSDERLKTFGENIKIDFDKLSKLRKSYFVFNDSSNNNHIGVSAQEVKELYPEIVSENENGYLSVDYSKLSVIALSAIDELYKQNKSLEERLNKLEEKIK